MIDLRSDTVTQPGKEMREAMASAIVGDDVFGEDPTVLALQERVAQLLGKEAAIFAPSGTQSNLMGLMAHCERGDEYIVGNLAHTYKYEGGGAAVLGSIQPQPIDYQSDATFDLDKLESLIKPVDDHFARTRLICYENTFHGIAADPGHYHEARTLADRYGLAMHLDGARLFNAAVKLGKTAAELSAPFDTVSVCLSKGLGAPAGSLLAGSTELIRKAHRWRKVLGGGMRQAGILAAAGLYALENQVSRLQEDHDKAALLALELNQIGKWEVEFSPLQTNMVFLKLNEKDIEPLRLLMLKHQILIYPGKRLRLVTHRDVSFEDIKKVIEIFRKV
jgi:threonine aldolase